MPNSQNGNNQVKTGIDTNASDYVIALTRKRIDKLLQKLKCTRGTLVEIIMDTRPELKGKRHSVHAAVYSNQAFPYLYEILPEIKKPAKEAAEVAARRFWKTGIENPISNEKI